MIDGRWLWEQQRALVARHERRLGRALAEDLASEAAARCWRHPAPDGRHGPWLERIFRNLLVDHFRRRLPGDEPSAHPLVAPPSTPEDELLQNERRRAFARAWETVAPEQRAAIEARLTDQVTQFAQDRGLAPETIRTR
ncbi:MAG TPA: sigma-70 family RNA polymerase sigma factor, partial [Polyangia bacterium]